MSTSTQAASFTELGNGPTLKDFWRLRKLVHSDPWTNRVNIPVGAPLAFLCYHARLTPNQVSLLSLVVTTLGSVAYCGLATGLGSMIVIAALFQLGYAFDCADGQLARATNQGSAFGQWLDVAIDFASTISIPAAMTWYAISKLHCPFPELLIMSNVLLTYVRVMTLFTSSVQRIRQKQGPKRVGWLRLAFRGANDTGFLLFLFVIVRLNAAWMMSVMLVYSALGLVRAISMAKRMSM